VPWAIAGVVGTRNATTTAVVADRLARASRVRVFTDASWQAEVANTPAREGFA
jgi:hypothetical protein